MSHQSGRRIAAAIAALITAAGPLALIGGADAAPRPTQATASVASGWAPRPATWPGTAVKANIAVPMSDGLSLQGDLVLPANADGTPASGKFPVVVEITAYNKGFLRTGGASIGGDSTDFLVKRGYAFLYVDARGTGTSPGTWQVFGEREQKDAGEAVSWAAEQSWSDGTVGMVGPSYMGISQLFAAGNQPQGLKAIFPQVPGADVYRDIVASGGQLDVGFMPLWLGLVNLTGLMPTGTPDLTALSTILEHLAGSGSTSLQLALDGVTGGEKAYDGPWYRERSTLLQSVPKIQVPTFLIGGEYDLFQRGTPMIFQALQERGVPVKMILGPWNHLQGSSGADVVKAGYGTIAELQLRWFDHYVRGLADPALDSDIPDFTYYELGSGSWVKRNGYLTGQSATSYQLSGSALPTLQKGSLTTGPAQAGTAVVPPLPVSGLCTRSSSQWTAGFTHLLGLDNSPCDTDNRLNDLAGAVYETAPLSDDLRMLGPINVHLNASSATGDGMLSVHVSRVAPDGKVERLTGGWQVISLAQLDEARSTKVDGQIVQPWHPFTKASQRTLQPGEIAPVDVEVFPTGAVIRKGDRLRISVGAFDVPHLAPHLGVLTSAASVITLHTSPSSPSRIVLPTVGGTGAADDLAGGGTTAAGIGGAITDITGQLTGGAGIALPGLGGLLPAGTDPTYDATTAAADALARTESTDSTVAPATQPVSATRAVATQPWLLGGVGLFVLLLTTTWVRARKVN
jgi:putative CocE/NonD family hydrolase